MHDPWTLYWQADRLDSADAIHSATDYEPIRAWWHELAGQLDPSSAVIDLATGNGTVPAALLESNPELNVTAVDRAEIDPLRFLSDPGKLADVSFQRQVDVCSMPFDSGSFDAATSQFGIEYAPLAQAVEEAVRVLRNGGTLQLLLHCDDSAIVQPARDRRAEMDTLLADQGVLLALREYVAGSTSFEQLEASGSRHLNSGLPQTQGITGQIFSGVNQVIGFVEQGDRRSAAELCETMLLRLGADRDRLQALEAAAMDEQAFGDFVRQLQKAGIESEVAEAMKSSDDSGDGFVIGWKYRGRKT